MKFAPVAILFSALAAASPVYHVEWVTVTQYTTIVAGHDEYTSAFPQTTKTVLLAETPAAHNRAHNRAYNLYNCSNHHHRAYHHRAHNNYAFHH